MSQLLVEPSEPVPKVALAAPPARAARERAIANCVDGARSGHPVFFRGGYHEMPAGRVSEDVLVYRADNGRLIAELREHLRDRGRAFESFRAEQETAHAQRLLHRFLIAHAADPRGPIFQELERAATQVEPLLITADGVVVNGNRRLAAMRELTHRDPVRYAGFAEPLVAVLPADVGPEDIEYLEAALQMAPETKLAYGWINRRLKLRRQRDELGLPVERICDAYRLEDAGALAREIDELALAEDYLEGYRGEPGHYSLIDDAEALFVGLKARLETLDVSHRALWRLAGFAMIDGRTATERPLASYFPFAVPAPGHLPAWALRRLALETGLIEARAEAAQAEDSALHPSVRDDLAALLHDRTRSREMTQTLIDLLDRLRLEHGERRAPQHMLNKIREARDLLYRLDPERLNEEQRRRLRAELAAMRAQADYLLGDAERKPRRPRDPKHRKGWLDPPYRKVPARILRRLGLRQAKATSAPSRHD